MCLPATSWKHTQTSLKPSDLECMHIRHRLTCKLCEMNEALTWVKISIRLPNWTSDELCALHFLHLPPYLFFFFLFSGTRRSLYAIEPLLVIDFFYVWVILELFDKWGDFSCQILFSVFFPVSFWPCWSSAFWVSLFEKVIDRWEIQLCNGTG